MNRRLTSVASPFQNVNLRNLIQMSFFQIGTNFVKIQRIQVIVNAPSDPLNCKRQVTRILEGAKCQRETLTWNRHLALPPGSSRILPDKKTNLNKFRRKRLKGANKTHQKITFQFFCDGLLVGTFSWKGCGELAVKGHFINKPATVMISLRES